jgi:hypothetical protein
MKQTTLSVPLEVKPASRAMLADLIDRFHDTIGGNREGDFAPFMRQLPTVHFLSMSIFVSADYDPLFILEANFDGKPGPFWGQVEAAFGEELRAMLRCCKRPSNEDGPLFDAVTATGSRAPVAPYMEAQTQWPSVFHHGNRGMTRDCILAERALFLAIRDEIANANAHGPSPYRGKTPAEVHAQLRASLLPAWPWLAERPPARVPALTRIADIARLLIFAILVVLALSLPGLLAAPVMTTGRYAVLLGIATAAAALAIYRMRDPLTGTDTHGKTNLLRILIAPRAMLTLLVAVLLYLIFAVWILAPILTIVQSFATGLSLVETRVSAERVALLGLASLPFSMLTIMAWLRWLELRDSSHDAPPVDEGVLRQMAQREDWIPQNHMGSIVLLKPGILRTIIVHAGHLGLGLFLKVIPDSGVRGYLGSMRTVHFAHWAFMNNSSRLLFFSNFDQSWESYLDDFIEKAHAGLTLAWGCGVGFPPTRFLVQDGASHGRKFKAWARHSMAISRFWYSAYPDLTVDQIERNNRIANGLRMSALGAKEAAAWINEL